MILLPLIFFCLFWMGDMSSSRTPSWLSLRKGTSRVFPLRDSDSATVFGVCMTDVVCGLIFSCIVGLLSFVDLLVLACGASHLERFIDNL